MLRPVHHLLLVPAIFGVTSLWAPQAVGNFGRSTLWKQSSSPLGVLPSWAQKGKKQHHPAFPRVATWKPKSGHPLRCLLTIHLQAPFWGNLDATFTCLGAKASAYLAQNNAAATTQRTVINTDTPSEWGICLFQGSLVV